MGKFFKIVLITFSLFLIIGLILFAIFKFRLLPDPLARIYPSFAAKEGCSCLFVVKGSEEYCKDYVRQFFFPDEWIQGEDSLEVRFSSYFSEWKAKAIFRNSKGCRLE
ncbi:hypothetical protein EHQ53_15785 [Leptospira langatensis]|uniref:Uncharacterized protein n=2 Tax=Leptospira langatensis TaxID=2484983 RepID=A0A5F1ZPJ4_9LEPT|nr:hypothetical protein EHO57_00025 [Leptospira langatensis]TGL38755.1 hypothetical protein EHQ53_15785 [Leptospira langatensis]